MSPGLGFSATVAGRCAKGQSFPLLRLGKWSLHGVMVEDGRDGDADNNTGLVCYGCCHDHLLVLVAIYPPFPPRCVLCVSTVAGIGMSRVARSFHRFQDRHRTFHHES